MNRQWKNSTAPSSSARPQTVRIPTVLVLGDTDRAEMTPIVAWMKNQVLPAARAFHAGDVPEIHRLFSGDLFPDLIVVLQSWSDQYSATDIQHLLSFAPLARLLVCYGSWCESDGRNRNRWPLSVRVPVWAAVQRIEREWRLITDSTATSPLPWSASREEVFAADHSALSIVSDWTGRTQTFLIESPDIHYLSSVHDLLSAMGHHQDLSNPGLILFDADPWNNTRCNKLNELRKQFPHAQFAILTNCIDHSSFAEFRKLGFDQIIHKLGFREQFIST